MRADLQHRHLDHCRSRQRRPSQSLMGRSDFHQLVVRCSAVRSASTNWSRAGRSTCATNSGSAGDVADGVVIQLHPESRPSNLCSRLTAPSGPRKFSKILSTVLAAGPATSMIGRRTRRHIRCPAAGRIAPTARPATSADECLRDAVVPPRSRTRLPPGRRKKWKMISILDEAMVGDAPVRRAAAGRPT